MGVVGLLAVAGCEDAPPPPPVPVATTTVAARAALTGAAASASGKAAIPPDALTVFKGKTQDPNFEAEVIDSAVVDARRLHKLRPKDAGRIAALIAALLKRATLLGKYSGFDEAVTLGELYVEHHPKSRKAYMTRAAVRAAVHRFDEALADLETARGLRGDVTAIEGERGVILMALGRYDEAHAIFAAQAKERPRTKRLVRLALVLGHLGKYEEARQKFLEAEQTVRGLSGSELANLYFNHGAMWERAGDRDKAKLLYRAAVKSQPNFAHAVGHLVALLSDEEAEPLLAKIVEVAEDPELVATLGAVRNQLKPGSGTALIEKSKKDFEALMKKHPLAFADHAGWFWLDLADDPKKAVEAARINLAARKPPAAYELMIAAQLGAKDTDGACKTADEGLKLKYTTHGLKELAAEAYEACGNEDRAAKLRADAPKHDDRHHAH